MYEVTFKNTVYNQSYRIQSLSGVKNFDSVLNIVDFINSMKVANISFYIKDQQTVRCFVQWVITEDSTTVYVESEYILNFADAKILEDMVNKSIEMMYAEPALKAKYEES